MLVKSDKMEQPVQPENSDEKNKTGQFARIIVIACIFSGLIL
jgi:hypothetical protein